jgi:hypothetical protein
MKDDRTMIGCSPDGIPPVIFRIEGIGEYGADEYRPVCPSLR